MCRLYNVFGSGASHAIYAQFMAQSALANRGRKVCLIRGAGTRAFNLIRIAAPGPAWEESMLPADFILLTLIPLAVFNPTHRVGLTSDDALIWMRLKMILTILTVNMDR